MYDTKKTARFDMMQTGRFHSGFCAWVIKAQGLDSTRNKLRRIIDELFLALDTG